MRSRKDISVLVSCLLALLITMGCDIVEREEIGRLPSPDLLVDAIVVRTNAGATTDYGYRVYIKPIGEKPTGGDEIFIGDKLLGLRVAWNEAGFLNIEYSDGRVFHFSNFWQSKKIRNFEYIVHIDLVHCNGSG